MPGHPAHPGRGSRSHVLLRTAPRAPRRVVVSRRGSATAPSSALRGTPWDGARDGRGPRGRPWGRPLDPMSCCAPPHGHLAALSSVAVAPPRLPPPPCDALRGTTLATDED